MQRFRLGLKTGYSGSMNETVICALGVQ